jgi:prophage tail gpP-like protein
MRLEVNGVQYTNFTAASCDIRLDSLSNTFRFDAVAPDAQALPFKGGEECKVIVDGEPVLTGSIEVVDVDFDGSDHKIIVSGRDKTANILDSRIDRIDDIRGDGLTLKSLIERVISELGLDIEVVDEANPPPFNGAEDIAAPEPGDNAFEFIEKYAQKRQVLLTSNSDGNIVITSNSGQVADGRVQHIIDADDNNVISGRFRFDTTGRYNLYRISSDLNPTALNLSGNIDISSIVNQSGVVVDSDIRPGRQLIIISNIPFSDAACEDRAKWEADIRRARGLVYSVRVPQFRVGGDQGDLWRINRIYQIVDDFVGKIEPMLCNSVTFTFDVNNGRNTNLGFVGQKAYTLFLEPDPLAEEAGNVK